MDNDAQNLQTAPVAADRRDAALARAPLADPAAVDDSDEEDGRL
jgi:hypothetical protein